MWKLNLSQAKAALQNSSRECCRQWWCTMGHTESLQHTGDIAQHLAKPNVQFCIYLQGPDIATSILSWTEAHPCGTSLSHRGLSPFYHLLSAKRSSHSWIGFFTDLVSLQKQNWPQIFITYVNNYFTAVVCTQVWFLDSGYSCFLRSLHTCVQILSLGNYCLNLCKEFLF